MTFPNVPNYKIIKKINAGGMGVVYKAENLKLRRLVALKFLVPALCADPSIKKRFLHEAQIISALDHINIGTIYDFDESYDGQIYIAMAFYDGESLKSRLRSVRLTREEAINIIIQIAQGLAKAHNQGILHRDIKPGNVLITNEGIVKIIDFGLAKYANETGMTRTGSTLGTLAYMSPEQVQNEPVDERTDIWSLGVMFYEMLTGKRPFEGDNEAALIYAILTREPDDILRQDPNLNRIVRKLLEKNPQKRFKRVNSFIDDLVETGIAESEERKEKNQVRQKSTFKLNFIKHAWKILSAVMLLIILSVAIFDFGLITSADIAEMKTIPIVNREGQEIFPSFSPDGKQIAYSGSEGRQSNTFSLFVKLVDIGEPMRLTSSPGYDINPVWSPDGKQIAFYRRYSDKSGIYIIPALGGTETKVVTKSDGIFARNNISWSPCGKYILYSEKKDNSTNAYCIFKIVLESRVIMQLSDPPDGYMGDMWSAISPDGELIALVREKSWGQNDIYVGSAAGHDFKRITFEESHIEGITWGSNGEDIIFSSNRSGRHSLWRINKDGGKPEPLTPGGHDSIHPVVSRSGNLLAIEQIFRSQNLWKVNIGNPLSDTKNPVQLTSAIATYSSSDISPNNTIIAYQSNVSGSYEIWLCDFDGKNNIQLTNFGDEYLNVNTGFPKWSPDGNKLVFSSSRKGDSDIFLIDPRDGRPRAISANRFIEGLPSWSGDGKWIYFHSNRTGDYEIWKIPSKGGESIQVTREGGFTATETNDGKYLYFSKFAGSGIWKMNLEDNTKNLILDKNVNFASWVLAEEGIYYLVNTYNGEAVLNYYSFNNKTVKKCLDLGKGWVQFLTISRDYRTILYSHVDDHESDIYMVENFR